MRNDLELIVKQYPHDWTTLRPELQYLELSSKRDSNRNRTVRKIMNYHAIQL